MWSKEKQKELDKLLKEKEQYEHAENFIETLCARLKEAHRDGKFYNIGVSYGGLRGPTTYEITLYE